MLRLLIVIAIAAMSSGCVPVYVHADLNPDFSSTYYRTVAWGAEPPLLSAPADFRPDRAALIQETIRRKLIGKGYRWTESTSGADLLVVYLAHTREVELPSQGSSGHNFDEDYNYDRYGRGSAHMSDRYTEEPEILHQGHLDVNIWDAASGEIYWHGYVERITDDVTDDNAANIADEVFDELFESLPNAAP